LPNHEQRRIIFAFELEHYGDTVGTINLDYVVGVGDHFGLRQLLLEQKPFDRIVGHVETFANGGLQFLPETVKSKTN